MTGGRQVDGVRAVLIAGPTASGKSALALQVAERLGGIVINADSMQVYRELRILTARPDADDEARVDHRLYGHVGAGEAYTVARWLKDLERVLAEARADGRLPVIVGGTGLYLTAATEGLSEIPPVPGDIRDRWRLRAAGEGSATLHAVLAARDPLMAARLRPADTQRILRALEVLDATGRSLAAWQAIRQPPLLPRDAVLPFVVAPDRQRLHLSIARRFQAMVDAGGLDEAARFAALGLDPALPAMKAIGVPEMVAAASGGCSIEDAVRRAVVATRQFAKRQETWFKNQMPDWTRLASGDSAVVLQAVSSAAPTR